MLKIGQGYDAHCLTEGGQLVLCGVKIPYEKSLAAHSDGDVALHALCDALLGAAGLGDIGKHFPDTDPDLKGIDSRILLRHVRSVLVEKGYDIVNADVTIVAQKPKISPYIEAMRSTLAGDLEILPENINVKATTTEGMGFEGRGEGISSLAVALISKK